MLANELKHFFFLFFTSRLNKFEIVKKVGEKKKRGKNCQIYIFHPQAQQQIIVVAVRARERSNSQAWKSLKLCWSNKILQLLLDKKKRNEKMKSSRARSREQTN